ncbi:MAG: hypothetical protein Kow0090_16310 [Myxococcota bacterium]
MEKKDKKTLICAHRGMRGEWGENTMEAFRAAVAAGADMIEFDVRRTACGKLVVHHDPAIGAGELGKPISTIGYEELNEIAKEMGFRVPLLREVLSEFGDKTLLDIELKDVGYEREVIREALSIISPERFVITSFNDETVKRVKEIAPEVRTGLLLGDERKKGLLVRLSEGFPVLRLKRCKADFAATNIKLLRLGFIERLRLAGIPVWVWTVNDEEKIKSLLGRVEVIITDELKLAMIIAGN